MAKKKKTNAKRKSGSVKKAKAAKTASPAAKSTGRRTSWLDDRKQSPRINELAQQLQSFLQAMADGRVDEAEIEAQEQRLVKLMKAVEPKLSDELHAQVTELLCELTAYDLMQMLHVMEKSRPKAKFHG